jgi:UDP-N-acetylglucosamine/UDP-N-acetylgalactosamine diphosphorylase
MNLSSENFDRIEALLDRGVKIPHPDSVHVGPDVDLDRITPGAVLYAGTRLAGPETWIGPDASLGMDGPATVVDCQVGPEVSLKGGSFRRSVFLRGASVGSGAEVRERCLLEEQASGAHTVGLKQTILFPFVTLGSLINFCDCFMAGGTSRKNHSEVGSSYIHFNYTPHQDKATASRFGDVPRGVMLDRPPIFLGGQGGAVGPLHLGYGTIVPAGWVVRRDCPDGGCLLAPEAPPHITGFQPGLYRSVKRIVDRNVDYIGGLHALKRWYLDVRKPFLTGALEPLFAGAVATIERALDERIKRLVQMAGNMERSIELGMTAGVDTVKLVHQQELFYRRNEIGERLQDPPTPGRDAEDRDRLLGAIEKAKASRGSSDEDYVAVIQSLDDEDRIAGTRWLDDLVAAVRKAVVDLLPSFREAARL